MITIHVTPLSYRIKVGSNGQLLGTSVYLTHYLNRFSQMTWDRHLHRSVVLRRFVHYNPVTSILYLPRYDFESFCGLLRSHNIAYTVEYVKLQHGLIVDIPIKPGVQDRDAQQTEAIDYLSTGPDALRGLSISTGGGKTYSTIKSLSRMGRRTMICVGGLVDQWKLEIFKFTTLTEDDIYTIQGAASMSRLLQQIDKKVFPKIILCSLGTIRPYATGKDSYENYPPFEELFDLLQVGIKVIDEAHLNFYLTLLMDMQTNAAVNIALTATFDRGDHKVKQIYDAHYPKLMRFGEGKFDRYVNVFSYSYSLDGMLQPKHYMTQMGYNHSKFEEWLLRKGKGKLDYLYRTVYEPTIHSQYINIKAPGQKLLILCSTVDMCSWFRDKLIETLPQSLNLRVELYNYETDDSILSDADIIISTPGSAGTGRDIKQLRTVIMTIATGSDNTNIQTLGRLRKLPSGDTPVYIYTWCRDIKQHGSYHDVRRITYSNRSLEFREVDL